MNALHKRKDDSGHEKDTGLTVACEETEYEDDVTLEAVQLLRDRAAKAISEGCWTVIDGYAPKQSSLG
ncbi:MAG: hypothetical protein WDN46_10450 [Methylocella sp.]